MDRTFVDTRFLSRSPEEIASSLDGIRPTARALLERLAGEGAIAIHADRAIGHAVDDDDGDAFHVRLQMRRVAPDTALTLFERAVLDDLFGHDRELTTASHHARHAGTHYDPQDDVDRRLDDAARTTGQKGGPGSRRGGRWSLAQAVMAAVFVGGLVGIFRNIGPLFDGAPLAALGAFLMVALVTGWPVAWWHRGRPARGLLVPLIVLLAIHGVWLLIPNRPVPAEAWLASAVAATAGYFLTLTRSRLPGSRSAALADLLRMRDYAAAELGRARPQLDDRWIPRLRALGLGRAIDAWRARHGGARAMPPDSTDRPHITTAHFTGVGPQPWAGPPHWSDPLLVYDDDSDESEDADDSVDAEDTDDAATGDDAKDGDAGEHTGR